MTHDDDSTTISPELAAKLAALDPIDTTISPEIEASIAAIDAALEGLTGEERRQRAASFRFRGAGHLIWAVPDLPTNNTDDTDDTDATED